VSPYFVMSGDLYSQWGIRQLKERQGQGFEGNHLLPRELNKHKVNELSVNNKENYRIA
jgi:hypothetical protein